jgi:general secretion pathway protein A
MYEQFYGLNERPFDLTPNPRYLLKTLQHREALSTIGYAITTAKGITLLIGEAGTGKTTVLRAALAALPPGSLVATLTNPTLTRNEFLEYAAWKLQLGEAASQSKAQFLIELQRVLEDYHQRQLPVALIVDEAHTLSHELLEEIRLIANLQGEETGLISVVLTGQPELGERLNSASLRQLKQRIALRSELTPFTIQETAAYIAGRIRVAGGITTHLFTREAVMLIHSASQGIPRTISVICDNALIAGFAMDQKPVGRDVIHEVCRDLDLLRKGASAAAETADGIEPLYPPVPEAPPAPPAPVGTVDDDHQEPAVRGWAVGQWLKRLSATTR